MLIMMCCRRFSVTCTSGSRSQRVVAPDCQIARREHFHHRRPGAAEAVRSLADSPAGRHPPEGLAVAPARELAARLHRHEAVRWQRLAEGDERLEDGDALGQALQGSQGAIPTTRLVSVLGGTGVDSTLCGHLPKFVARRVRSRLPPPPPSPPDARTPGSRGANSAFFFEFQVIAADLGRVPKKTRRGRGKAAASVQRIVSRTGFRGPVFRGIRRQRRTTVRAAQPQSGRPEVVAPTRVGIPGIPELSRVIPGTKLLIARRGVQGPASCCCRSDSGRPDTPSSSPRSGASARRSKRPSFLTRSGTRCWPTRRSSTTSRWPRANRR